MADMWTDNISAELYTNFLRFTVSKIAVVSADGKLQWRSDDDITGLMKEHHMNEEEKEERRRNAEQAAAADQHLNPNVNEEMQVLIGKQTDLHSKLQVGHQGGDGSGGGQFYGLGREHGTEHEHLNGVGNNNNGNRIDHSRRSATYHEYWYQ